jgi:hypothetical protein
LSNIATKLDTLDEINNKLTSITEGNTKIIEDVGKLTEKCTKLELDNSVLGTRLDKAENRIDKLEMHCNQQDVQIAKLTRENTWQEGIIKKVNLIFTGIEEKHDKEQGSSMGSIRMVLKEKMEMDLDTVNIVNCHRLGQFQPTGAAAKGGQGGNRGPRPILVCFNTIADRTKVWQQKRKLKGSDYFIAEDYAKEVEKRRSTLLPILRSARASGEYKDKAYMVADKLVLDNKRYTVETLDQLPANVDPKRTATQTIGNVTFFFTKDSVFSNHNMDAPFRIGSTTYRCTEQRFFAAKAALFGDQAALDKIMAAKEAATALQESKKIINYTKENWEAVEINEMTHANRNKYLQNPAAMAALMATGETRMAEASRNKEWGIGFALHNPNKTQQQKWGKNKLGGILELLRKEFKK